MHGSALTAAPLSIAPFPTIAGRAWPPATHRRPSRRSLRSPRHADPLARASGRERWSQPTVRLVSAASSPSHTLAPSRCRIIVSLTHSVKMPAIHAAGCAALLFREFTARVTLDPCKNAMLQSGAPAMPLASQECRYSWTMSSPTGPLGHALFRRPRRTEMCVAAGLARPQIHARADV